MTIHQLKRSHKEKVQIWITVWIVLVLSGFRLFVEVQPQIEVFFAAYTEFPVAVVGLNLLFFWLLFLMLIAYRRWRQSILAEQELERVLMSISPDALVVVNRERVISMVSGQVKAMFGISDRDLIGRKTDVLYNDRRVRGEKGEIASRLERYGFHVGYATGKRKDGSTFPLEVITGTIRFQQGAVVLMRDITERCRIEDALRQSEIRFEQFMRYFPGFAFIKDREGRRIYLNDAHASERGWDIEACIGRKDTDLYREDLAMQYRESDLRVLREQKAVRYMTRILEDDDKVRSLLTVKFPLPVTGAENDDQDMMIAGLSLDISDQEAAERERMKIEQQMQQAQKLESLGVLAGGIAHDFNNLLMGVIGHADLALADGMDAEQMRSHMQSVIQSCQRAADLANQLLAYSGKGSFVLASTDMSDVVTDLRDLLKVSISKKAMLQFDLAESLPAVQCDVTQIRQVLMNLIVNASDALEERAGVISVETGVVSLHEQDEPLVCDSGLAQQTLAPGEYVYTKITDNGIGMTEKTRQKIFDPFFTTKKTGHGLGLAAVLGIIRSHEGGIKIDSTPGEGTTCTVYLPSSEKSIPVKEVEETFTADWQGAGKVLLADDENMVREVAAMMLTRLGFDVIAVPDGAQAMKQYAECGSEFQALLLDVTMPELGGVEACNLLLEQGCNIPIIMSSGYNQKENQDAFPVADNVFFLKKPYRMDALREVLQKALSDQ